jgi:multicomponent Na+:H+ antiporter subunit F
MNLVKWTAGLILFLVFFIWNFFFYDAELIPKLINVLLFSSTMVLFRVLIGPSAADRIVAVDILGILIVGLLALLGLYYNQNFFIDIALIWALLSFIATLAFSKVLEGRQLDD